MKSYTLNEVFTKTPAELIFILERDAKWTQEEIAYVAETSQPTIFRIRSGIGDAKYSVVRRLQETVLRLHEMDGAIA